jgi:Ca-activated chloride channel homolog
VTFLGPISMTMWAWFAAGAAALAITAYILKMRRRRFEVPFSSLWKRVLEQKDVTTLWKQLRRWISMLVALLVLGLLLFAVLDPTLGVADRRARSVVVLLDASASMRAIDGGGEGDSTPRLEAAKNRAKALVDSMGGGDVAMIMKVDGQATPLSRFSNDAPKLRKAIDDVTASDTPADLTRALGAAADALRDRKNPLIVIVSDGAFPEQQLGLASWEPAKAGATTEEKNLAAVDLSGIDVRYLPVGRRSDNVGIISFNVRRYVANKAAYEVFIEVQNFGAEVAHRKLTLYNGDTAVDTRDLDLPPAGQPGSRQRQIYKELPGGEDHRLRASLRPVEGPGGSDPFPLDDEAFALLPARKKQKVLIVSADNLYLEGAILVYDNVEPDKITPAEYDAKPEVGDSYDAVIFDEHTPAVVPNPPVNLIYFHPTGEHTPIALRGTQNKPRITEVAEDHPVMRWVTLSDVNFDKSEVFAPDRNKGESWLALSVRDPVIAAKRETGRKVIAFGFSLPGPGREDATDLPLRVAFPLLLVNALDWFAGDEGDLITTYPTGQRQRVPLDGVVGATEAEITAPDAGATKTRAPIVDGVATFYARNVGFHTLEVKAQPATEGGPPGPTITSLELAANLASPVESDIGPSTELTLGGKKLTAPEAFAVTRSQKLWLYLLLLVGLIIAVEWVTYHRRITV